MIPVATIVIRSFIRILAPSCEQGRGTSVHTQVVRPFYSDPHPLSRDDSLSARARAELTGCPWHDVKAMLRQAACARRASVWRSAGSFSPRRSPPHRRDALRRGHQAKVPISLATVYNALHQFTDVACCASRGRRVEDLFDTNVSDHHHFFVEGENALVDIPNAMSRSTSCRWRLRLRSGARRCRVRLKKKTEFSAEARKRPKYYSRAGQGPEKLTKQARQRAPCLRSQFLRVERPSLSGRCLESPFDDRKYSSW